MDSAGLNADAENLLSSEQVAWADIIFVMEKAQRMKLQRGFRKQLRAKVVCLDIPDDYAFMDPDLVRILNERVPRHLG